MPLFEVLAEVDGSRRQIIVSPEQRGAAVEHGFVESVFSVDAMTRQEAQKAWDRHRGWTGAANEDEGLDVLTAPELAAVVGLVTALVAHDEDVLRAAGAYELGSDPYLWTRSYGRWDHVDLVIPPGHPRDWSGGVLRDASNPGWAAIVVDMWTPGRAVGLVASGRAHLRR